MNNTISPPNRCSRRHWCRKGCLNYASEQCHELVWPYENLWPRICVPGLTTTKSATIFYTNFTTGFTALNTSIPTSPQPHQILAPLFQDPPIGHPHQINSHQVPHPDLERTTRKWRCSKTIPWKPALMWRMINIQWFLNQQKKMDMKNLILIATNCTLEQFKTICYIQ